MPNIFYLVSHTIQKSKEWTDNILYKIERRAEKWGHVPLIFIFCIMQLLCFKWKTVHLRSIARIKVNGSKIEWQDFISQCRDFLASCYYYDLCKMIFGIFIAFILSSIYIKSKLLLISSLECKVFIITVLFPWGLPRVIRSTKECVEHYDISFRRARFV